MMIFESGRALTFLQTSIVGEFIISIRRIGTIGRIDKRPFGHVARITTKAVLFPDDLESIAAKLRELNGEKKGEAE